MALPLSFTVLELLPLVASLVTLSVPVYASFCETAGANCTVTVATAPGASAAAPPPLVTLKGAEA
ncbi:MAG: hypothetical protein ACRDOE_25255, partial [Streptosporangiaceae bacterium]